MSWLQFTRVPPSAGPGTCHNWCKEEECDNESCTCSPAMQLCLNRKALANPGGFPFQLSSGGWCGRNFHSAFRLRRSCQYDLQWARHMCTHFEAHTPTLCMQGLMRRSRINPQCVSPPTGLTCLWRVFCGVCRLSHWAGVSRCWGCTTVNTNIVQSCALFALQWNGENTLC